MMLLRGTRADALMPTLEKQITIRAPPAKVYGVLTDFGSATTWIQTMKECKQTTPGAFGVGTKAKQPKVIQGKATEVEVTVAKAEKDKLTQLVAVPKGRP